MIFESYYLECLSQASYLVADEETKKAIIVDPQRDIDIYIEDLNKHDLELVYIFETHIHADFLSGHLELAKKTGAKIVFGANAKGRLGFESSFASDGELFILNENGVQIGVLETPGHTPESITVAVFENPPSEFSSSNYSKPTLILSGDTLFVGDVGRPDLLGSVGLSPKEMAKQLYGSLRNKILKLDDSTGVYPAHGAGSACGKSLSNELSSTIGEQRKSNYALANMSEKEFIDLITEGQPLTPQYFSHSVAMNMADHELLDDQEKLEDIELEKALKLREDNTVIVDVRSPTDFSLGHIVASINIGLDGRFAETAGQLFSPATKIILAGEKELTIEAKVRLARIGYDNVIGQIKDFYTALETNPQLVASSNRIDVKEFRRLEQYKSSTDKIQIVDVRSPSETLLGVAKESLSIPLARLHERYEELDPNKPVIVYCAGGWRSSVGASYLESKGFKEVFDLVGGYNALSLVS